MPRRKSLCFAIFKKAIQITRGKPRTQWHMEWRISGYADKEESPTHPSLYLFLFCFLLWPDIFIYLKKKKAFLCSSLFVFTRSQLRKADYKKRGFSPSLPTRCVVFTIREWIRFSCVISFENRTVLLPLPPGRMCPTSNPRLFSILYSGHLRHWEAKSVQWHLSQRN